MIWVLAILAGSLGAGCFLWYAASFPRSQVFGPTLVRGPIQGKRIALTFDDGPSLFTAQILDILRERQVKATFFVLGKNAEEHPEILRRMSAEGHSIGNHTWSHPFPYLLGRKEFAAEVDKTQEVVERITGHRPALFRPPYGARWFGMFPALRERSLQVVQWSDSGYDWKGAPGSIADATLNNLKPGSIILLHDALEGTEGFFARLRLRLVGKPQHANSQTSPLADRSGTVAALPEIIDSAHQAGFQFVGIEEFL